VIVATLPALLPPVVMQSAVRSAKKKALPPKRRSLSVAVLLKVGRVAR